MEQVFDVINEGCNQASLELGKDLFIGVDMGAGDLYDADNQKYEIAQGQVKPVDDLIKQYDKWMGLHNGALRMLASPFHDSDKSSWEKFRGKCEDKEAECTPSMGQRMVLVGDYLYRSDSLEDVTEKSDQNDGEADGKTKMSNQGGKGKKDKKNPPAGEKGKSAKKGSKSESPGKESLKTPESREEGKEKVASEEDRKARDEEERRDGQDSSISPEFDQMLDPSKRLGNCLLLTPSQCVTVSRALNLAGLCNNVEMDLMVSHASNDSECTFISDFAVGIGSAFVKCGAPNRSERVSKYNRLVLIEDYLRDEDLLMD